MLKLLCFSGLKMVQTGHGPLLKGNLGTRMMIMREEQLVDPPIANITSVNVKKRILTSFRVHTCRNTQETVYPKALYSFITKCS